MFSLLGTWLPAGIYGQEKGFGAALRRGTKTFFPVFARLLAANFAAFALVIAFLVAISAYADGATDAKSGVMAALFDVLTSIIGIATTTYIAVVLVETYRIYEAARLTQAPASDITMA